MHRAKTRQTRANVTRLKQKRRKIENFSDNRCKPAKTLLQFAFASSMHFENTSKSGRKKSKNFFQQVEKACYNARLRSSQWSLREMKKSSGFEP
ncbi:MAG: hypothetical protein KBD96_01310 [Brachymonas sp.]|jgi:hypothetical protein|nr:hypothetical protein [Brachymonas sp.]MBP6967033.1 hypothetical protein [Brachymonas sp.]MBP7740451.1 hypothetical protein [Brachymonas sp.]MBP8596679.1 hypothetical protein [Brachymonas sp.]MBP8747102.1 hypothetical protein [Brachymonas sp.]